MFLVVYQNSSCELAGISRLIWARIVRQQASVESIAEGRIQRGQSLLCLSRLRLPRGSEGIGEGRYKSPPKEAVPRYAFVPARERKPASRRSMGVSYTSGNEIGPRFLVALLWRAVNVGGPYPNRGVRLSVSSERCR